MRCFLGIALPDPAREILAAQCRAWKGPGLLGSWVRPGNFHITVRFLGEVTETQRVELDRALGPAFSACGAARIRVAGAGVFPNARRPRVLWAGVEMLSGTLTPVFAAAEACARSAGLPAERKAAKPHVTLLRLRRPPARGVVEGLLEDAESLATDAFTVDSVALWKSTLGSGGACYEQLREYPLS